MMTSSCFSTSRLLPILCWVCLSSFGALAQGPPQVSPLATDPFSGVQIADVFNDGDSRPGLMRTPATESPRSSLEAEQNLLRILDEMAILSFIEEPLISVADSISKSHDTRVVIDAHSLDGVGLDADVPVTLKISGISLRSGLNLLLDQLELTYMIQNEALVITTRETAEKNPSLRVYAVPFRTGGNQEEMLEVLKQTVMPSKWQEKGGQATSAVIDNMLVVSAPELVQQAVVDFINKMEDASAHRQTPAQR